MSEVRVGVGVFIIDDQNRVLLGYRVGSHGAGTWGLPGGHVEYGEQPLETARREVLEETGMELGHIWSYSMIPYVTNIYPDEHKQYITLYFVAEHLGHQPCVMEPRKCIEWRWFPLHALPDALFESEGYMLVFSTMACGGAAAGWEEDGSGRTGPNFDNSFDDGDDW